jgi:hypothetical protein
MCQLCLSSAPVIQNLVAPVVRHLFPTPDFVARPKAAHAKSGSAIERTYLDAG